VVRDIGGGHGVGRADCVNLPRPQLADEEAARYVASSETVVDGARSSSSGASTGPAQPGVPVGSTAAAGPGSSGRDPDGGDHRTPVPSPGSGWHDHQHVHVERPWLPRRNRQDVPINGHASLAPLSRMLPPPWNTGDDENARWLESSSTQLATAHELQLLCQNLPHLDPSSDGESDTTAVGRWGEELVFSHFDRGSSARDHCTCVWVNKDGESGLPYDIRLEDTQTNSSIFIEVKTTVTSDRHIFPISGAELRFAQQNGSSYWVVRVYGGGTDGVKMCKIESLMEKVERGAIGLLLVM
jgi:hypothetical protein